MQGLRETPFLDGGTKFDVALKTVVDQDMFSIANGGRANSVKIVLIMTNRASKDTAAGTFSLDLYILCLLRTLYYRITQSSLLILNTFD